MKLRFKYQKKFHIFSINEVDPTVSQLIQGAAEKYDLNINNIEISLNANDYYDSENNGLQKASDLKIVNGDIIHVRLNGIYEDIKTVVRLEIAMKLEDVLFVSKIDNNSPLLMKLSIPIHLFMSETGFSIPTKNKPFIETVFPNGNTEPVTNELLSQVENINSSQLIRLTYNYLFNDSSVIYLTIHLFNSHVCVYGSYSESKTIHFYNFKVKEFILQNQPRNAVYRADYIYKNLSTFSTSFKNLISVPLRIDIHLDHFIPTHPFLQILPYDVLHRIFGYLDLKGILMVMSTCRRLNEAGRFCNKIWLRKLVKMTGKSVTKDPENINITDEGESDLYYKKYLSYQKERKLKRKAGSSITKDIHELYYI